MKTLQDMFFLRFETVEERQRVMQIVKDAGFKVDDTLSSKHYGLPTIVKYRSDEVFTIWCCGFDESDVISTEELLSLITPNSKICIKSDGTKEHGAAIIKHLESLGGSNALWNYDGTARGHYYYISERGFILGSSDTNPPRDYTEISLKQIQSQTIKSEETMINKKEYKVGDVVRIQSREWIRKQCKSGVDIDCPASVNGACFVSSMFEYAGKTATIIRESGTNRFRLEGCGSWNWSNYMFDPTFNSKTNNRNIIVTSNSVSLLEAFEAEAERVSKFKSRKDWNEQHPLGQQGIMLYILFTVDDMQFAHHNHGCSGENPITFTLPQQWDEALEAVKNTVGPTVKEFKFGDSTVTVSKDVVTFNSGETVSYKDMQSVNKLFETVHSYKINGYNMSIPTFNFGCKSGSVSEFKAAFDYMKSIQ